MHIAFLNPQGNFDAADSHLTAHPDFGGQLVYVKQVALAMAAAGHRVDILTRRIVDPAWPEFAEPEEHLDGGVRIVRLDAGDDRSFLPKEELWPFLPRDWVPNILALYGDGLPNAFTAHYGDGGLAGALLREHSGVPFTFTAHSLGAQKRDKLAGTANSGELEARYHFATRLAAERRAMAESVVNITSTHQERSEQYGHPAYAGAVDITDDDRFAVVPPGVNLATFHPEPEPGDGDVAAVLDAAFARDLSPDRIGLPAIVSSSRLDPKKNITGLVRAYAQAPDLQDEANLVLLTGAVPDPLHGDAGAGPDERQLLAEVRLLAPAGKVAGAAVPGQPALAAAYRVLAARRSVFALTALYEPFGLAPLEAAACGLPVVVTANGGPTESLRDGDAEYGVLVDPADPGDIARGLERVVVGGEWDALAAAGRRRVLDTYTWDRTAAGYAEVLTP